MSTMYNVEVFNFKTGDFSGKTVSIPRSTFTIGFIESRRTGNFIVTFVNPTIPPRKKGHRQEICVLPRYFAKVVPAITELGFAGAVDVTRDQLQALGFIYEDAKEATYDAV